jgi:esterase/lipase
MKNTYVLLALLSFLFTVSCTTYNHRNPYPGIEIINTETATGYLFMNENSQKLVINIEGSGWNSVLGIEKKKKWIMTMQGAQFLQVLKDKYSVYIPEKLTRKPGNDYFNDLSDRAEYTADKLINCYISSIKKCLDTHRYNSITIIGTSEGAFLLPIIYQRLKDKYPIKALVSCSAGGLSLYESYSLLSKSDRTPKQYRIIYNSIISDYSDQNTDKSNLDDYQTDYYGLTNRWFNSFLNIKPAEYYKSVEIPVLFIHGEKDFNIPVESTCYLQRTINNPLFEYHYYKWYHQPESYFDSINFRSDVAKWIEKL